MAINKAQFSTEDVLGHVWSTLQTCAQQRQHPMRTPVLSTIGLQNKPQACVVVLRAAEPGKLTCYTDTRSQKWLSLQANTGVSWTFYSPIEREQIRACGYATLHRDDAISVHAWQNVPVHSRQNYSSPFAPGQPIATPGQPKQGKMLEHHYFGVICSTITSIDWLWLGESAHRRLIWTSTHGGRWVSP